MKRIFIAALALFLIRPAFSAIAIDSTTAGNYASSGVNTWSHTCAGSNLLLTVNVWSDNASVTAVTYNGVSMTLGASFHGTYYISTYYLINPATGAHSVSLNGVGQTITTSISYTGAKQSGQFDATTSGLHTTGAVSGDTVTVVANNSWVIGVYSNTIGSADFPGTGTAGSTLNTQRLLGPIGFTGYMQSYDTNGPVSSGSNPFYIFASGDQVSGQSIDMLLFSIAPVAPTAVTRHRVIAP